MLDYTAPISSVQTFRPFGSLAPPELVLIAFDQTTNEHEPAE